MTGWETPPHGKGNKVQILDVKDGRYMVRHVGRREYRVFLNGQRTAYSGDTMAQAQAMVDHLASSMKQTQESER